VVERFNRTLKNEMWKILTLNGTMNYHGWSRITTIINIVQSVCNRLMSLPRSQKRFLSTVYSQVKIAAPAKFKVDEPVRVSKFETVFEKVYTPNWSTEVFKIVAAQRTNPVTYLIKDSRGNSIFGGLYEHQLLKTAQPDVYLVEKVLRRKDDKMFVKWLGLDSSHNSWIIKDNVM